jgi:hypothetical protein
MQDERKEQRKGREGTYASTRSISVCSNIWRGRKEGKRLEGRKVRWKERRDGGRKEGDEGKKERRKEGDERSRKAMKAGRKEGDEGRKAMKEGDEG